MLAGVSFVLISSLIFNFTFGDKINASVIYPVNETERADHEWSVDDEARLVHVLFNNYNKIVRPVKDKKAAVPVFLGIALAQLVDLGINNFHNAQGILEKSRHVSNQSQRKDEKNQILITSVWIRLRWINSFLHWNSSEFGGIASINVEPRLVWVPDIELYNSAAGDLSEHFKTRVILKSNGENVWYIPVILKSRCKVDIEYFPFDEQKCLLTFGSWTYHGFQLDFALSEDQADLAQYQASGEFELISARARRHVTKYSCCVEPYINLIFTIHFRRKILFYLNNLVVPCVLITLASLFTFILPPNTGERVTLVITTLLSLTVFMLMVAENTPTTSDVTPMIAKFFLASMLEIGLALVITCLILNVYHSTRHSLELPLFIRVLAIDVLAPLLRISTLKSERNPKQIKPNHLPREAKEEHFLLTHNLKDVQHVEPMNGHVPRDVMESPNDVIYLSSDRQHEPDEAVPSECDCRHVVVNCSCRGGLSSSGEQKLLNCVSYLAEREREKERQEMMLDEWEVVAKVADRSFLILFLLTISATTLLIFTQAPSHSETND